MTKSPVPETPENDHMGILSLGETPPPKGSLYERSKKKEEKKLIGETSDYSHRTLPMCQLRPFVVFWLPSCTLWLSIWEVNLLMGESSPDIRNEMPLSS